MCRSQFEFQRTAHISNSWWWLGIRLRCLKTFSLIPPYSFIHSFFIQSTSAQQNNSLYIFLSFLFLLLVAMKTARIPKIDGIFIFNFQYISQHRTDLQNLLLLLEEYIFLYIFFNLIFSISMVVGDENKKNERIWMKGKEEF